MLPGMAIIALSALFGCGREGSFERSGSDTAAVLRGSGRTDIPPIGRDTIAAVQVQWTIAEILRRLRSDGIAAEPGAAEVRQPFLAVAGTLISVPAGEIQVFLYGDAGAAGRDVARLDSTRVAPPGTMITWMAPPSLIWHNNLVAIVLTRDAGLRARIAKALRPGAHESVPAQP